MEQVQKCHKTLLSILMRSLAQPFLKVVYNGI